MNDVDFILIGSMKAGTTTLIDYLRQHPDIFISPRKEIQFFSRDKYFEKGIDWYRSNFNQSRENQIRGEGSTCYSRWPHFSDVPHRLHHQYPDIKLIYIVRDPVDRTYSHFRHSMLKSEIAYSTFSDALVNEPELIDASKYMMQIERFLEYFPRQQMLFLKFDDLAAAKSEFFTELFDFIGLSPDGMESSAPILSNQAGDKSTRKYLLKRLRNIRNSSLISPLVDRLLTSDQRRRVADQVMQLSDKVGIGRKIRKRKTGTIPPMLLSDREKIIEACAADLESFAQFSGLDLSEWCKSKSTNERQR